MPEDPETTTGPPITTTVDPPHPGFTTSIRPFTIGKKMQLSFVGDHGFHLHLSLDASFFSYFLFIESTTTTTIREYEEKGKYTAYIYGATDRATDIVVVMLLV